MLRREPSAYIGTPTVPAHTRGGLTLSSDPKWSRRGFLQSATAVTAGIIGLPELVPAGASAHDPKASRVYAQQAKEIIKTLQKRWYRVQPMAWWGEEQNAWNRYNTLEALIDYTHATGDRSYVPVIQAVAKDKALYNKVVGDGVDDQGWAAIALVKAHRLLGDADLLSEARSIFTTMTGFWDDTCGGGVWWNFRRTYKNAITNELFLMLATQLYQETKQDRFLDWAHREWNWFHNSGMLNSDNLINDGLQDCKNNQDRTWTYNQGVILGGLTNFYQMTQDRSFLDQATRIVMAVIAHLTQMQDGNRILEEPGRHLNSDQQQFKGIFMRYAASLAVHLPEAYTPQKEAIRAFVVANAEAVWKRASNNANEVNAYWTDTDDPPIYNATTQSSGLDLFNAACLLTRPPLTSPPKTGRRGT